MRRIVRKDNLIKAATQPRRALHMLAGSLRTRLAMQLGSGYGFGPTSIQVALTERCNLRCRMCPQWGDSGHRRGEDMANSPEVPVEVLGNLIDDIARHRPEVLVCGAEALLYKDWARFVEHVKSHGLFCRLGTNGLLLEREAERVVDSGLDVIGLSIDGPEEVHDGIRGVPGAFRRTLRGIAALKEARSTRGVTTPSITVTFTLSESNYSHIDEVVSVVREAGADALRIQHLSFVEREVADKHNEFFCRTFGAGARDVYGLVIDPGDIDVDFLVRKIDEVRNRRETLPISFFPELSPDEIRDYYRSSEFWPRSYEARCAIAWTHPLVSAEGEVMPCPGYVAGSIMEDDFKDIWNNDRYRLFRQTLGSRRVLPACARCCWLYYR